MNKAKAEFKITFKDVLIAMSKLIAIAIVFLCKVLSFILAKIAELIEKILDRGKRR